LNNTKIISNIKGVFSLLLFGVALSIIVLAKTNVIGLSSMFVVGLTVVVLCMNVIQYINYIELKHLILSVKKRKEKWKN
jgi:hypothetical protein